MSCHRLPWSFPSRRLPVYFVAKVSAPQMHPCLTARSEAHNNVGGGIRLVLRKTYDSDQPGNDCRITCMVVSRNTESDMLETCMGRNKWGNLAILGKAETRRSDPLYLAIASPRRGRRDSSVPAPDHAAGGRAPKALNQPAFLDSEQSGLALPATHPISARLPGMPNPRPPEQVLKTVSTTVLSSSCPLTCRSPT